MNNLPINEVLGEIKASLKSNSILILQAPPGAGKSTLVPISLLNESWLEDKMIVMLEPRRVAARMVATQMAKLLGEVLGERIGYQVKMESCYTQKTKILVVTEAILVRMLQGDQTLPKVALIIFDEFHERNINSDLSLALSLQVQDFLREDLKILIMSATLDSEGISKMLDKAPVISSKGRSYEVQNVYLDIKIKQPDAKTLNATLLMTTLNALRSDEGDILIFLSGIKEIKNLQKSLHESLKTEDILILPLYSALSKKEQDLVLQNSAQRKIILATNIAQTSLTIEGVRIVIDSGIEKLSRYNYANAMNHLETVFISKESAIQRAGRAGREADGKCYRLWHESKILQQSTKPEILRSDLSSLLLDLALWGVDDLSELQWLDIPNAKLVQESREVLQELQMLDDTLHITSFGKDALSLGLHPRFAYMILKANGMDYAYEACLLAALLSEKDIFINTNRESDILSRFMHLYEKDFDSAYIHRQRAQEVLKQTNFFYEKLRSVQKIKKKSIAFNHEILAPLLLLAYPDRLAKQRVNNDNRYKLSNAKGAVLHHEDSLFNQEFLVVPSLNGHEKESYIHLAMSISLEQIQSYFPMFIKEQETMSFNKQNKKFEVRQTVHFLKLELSSKPCEPDVNTDFKKLILDIIKKEGLGLLSWSEKAASLRARVNFVNKHSDEKLQEFSDERLLNTLDVWLEPYLEGVKTLKELEALELYQILFNLLCWEERERLEMLAPSFVTVPSGSKITIDYSESDKPSMSVKIQEVFGLHETPRVMDGLIALQIHLLSPAMRPIQITYDLKSFWENSYSEVRSELRGTYKRHYWPENPYEAVATNKTKKHMKIQ